MSVTMQQLSDCGINPFAVQLLWESWNRHKTSPRHAVTFPYRDAVISIQDQAEWQRGQERREDDDVAVDQDWLRSVGFRIFANFDRWYADIDIDGSSVDEPQWRTYLRLHSPIEGPPNAGECVADLFSEDEDGSKCGIGLTKSWAKTRGQVRRLTASLGIALADARGRG